ncbi:GIY-YIG nuclease family protein [Tumebacillus permanentifrigoris]|uniref:Putative endonuclease n=1 Tax=Tumebacillus permanentifrigoris TaxID=378543 RepID=A0A316DFD5_9BACL|nr:GIY-YIG nuclease family protein [Tumebacillus permanentifrigoris]PWK15909.1 putative endonuclease [Tumebacillus permanentifrigoris]
MVYVYLLECKDGSLYAGITTDLQKRLREHRIGKGAKYTRGRSPLILRYVELQLDRSSALRRELAVKRMKRQQKEDLIATICLLPHADVEQT